MNEVVRDPWSSTSPSGKFLGSSLVDGTVKELAAPENDLGQILSFVVVQTGLKGETAAHFQLPAYDVGEGGLAQSRRTAEQNMLERLLSFPRCADHDSKALDGFFLPREIIEARRAQGGFDVGGSLGYLFVGSALVHL